jgi:hypothetical protein
MPSLLSRTLGTSCILLGSLLLPLASEAQYQYEIFSHSVTNYTGYLLAAETGNAGRQAIRTRTVTLYSNPGSTPETVYFRLAYQLLDASSLPVPVLDETGQSNLVYSVYQTNTVPYFSGLTLIHSLGRTNAAPLQPLARLDPYQTYRSQLKLYASTTAGGPFLYYGTNALTPLRSYSDFTNTVSPDPSPNLLLTLDSVSLGQTWAIDNSPGQGGFPLSVGATVRRYDDFTLPPTSTNTTVAFNFQLLDAVSGAPVPLQYTQVVAKVRIASNDGGSPPSPVAVAVATNFSLMPAGQIDSVDSTYNIAVTLTHTEGSAGVIDHTNTIGPFQLLQFNGKLFFGSLLTYFTNLDSAPTVTNTVAGSHLELLLPVRLAAGRSGAHVWRRHAHSGFAFRRWHSPAQERRYHYAPRPDA